MKPKITVMKHKGVPVLFHYANGVEEVTCPIEGRMRTHRKKVKEE